MPFVGGMEFAQDLNDFIEDAVPQEFLRCQIDIAIFMWERFIHYTPIRTGHAKKNWKIMPFLGRGSILRLGEDGVRYGEFLGATTAFQYSAESYRTRFSYSNKGMSPGPKLFSHDYDRPEFKDMKVYDSPAFSGIENPGGEARRIMMFNRLPSGKGSNIGGNKSTTFRVYNNVRYMPALIDGHSQQAPQGWYEIVLMETRQFMLGVSIVKGMRDAGFRTPRGVDPMPSGSRTGTKDVGIVRRHKAKNLNSRGQR
jgi:hypothetical protein